MEIRPVSTLPVSPSFKATAKNKAGEDNLGPLTAEHMSAPDIYAEKKGGSLKKIVILAALVAGAVLLAKKMGFSGITDAAKSIFDKAKNLIHPVADKAKDAAQNTINK
ncbi:MAG: hypothetical protein A2287_06695 [Candidatus Melainabacteria bacterium RIFOXYA12_FULL_32_12]|nr:MAG: hypothetical protein A2255_00210 [Candidatus Melainabacteria bacterium RIFOXYA2_FULL_32_9]OGI25419.1 MAG: hypothetical protein A2287_06695 [Candidatus Melainabacteria bacterium RIFOXYA12_FULL_32_12]